MVSVERYDDPGGAARHQECGEVPYSPGLAYGPIGPLTQLAAQRRAPAEVRGRVVGVIVSANYVAGPLGFLVAGPMVQPLGVGVAFPLLACALLGFAVVAVFLGGLHELDRLPEPVAAR